MKKLHVKDLSQNPQNSISVNGFSIRVFHLPEDPGNSNRIRVSSDEIEVELLPSKGLSLGQAWINGRPIFWDAPVGLTDTETLDLWSDEIWINGNPAPGFTFLKTFAGGVEFYGLKNWGMPVMLNGKLQPLHGETSNIPVSEVQFFVDGDVCTVKSNFIYRTFEGDNNLPWYERGEEIFKVTKNLILTKNSPEIRIEDIIENISNVSQKPDWGYHVTFKPEPGAKYLVPARIAKSRGGGPLPVNYNIWQPSPDPKQRIENGIIYKDLQKQDNGDFCHSLLLNPDGSGIVVKTPLSPYFQTWFCAGGAGTKEFTRRNGEPVFKRNWDGIGIEFGSGALDHDGNTDSSVSSEAILHPKESRRIDIAFTFFDSAPGT
jgi:hypothetical protein